MNTICKFLDNMNSLVYPIFIINIKTNTKKTGAKLVVTVVFNVSSSNVLLNYLRHVLDKYSYLKIY